MNYIFFILKISIKDLLRNKLRAVLTSLGILIGIFSIVMLISLGLGLRKYIDDQFKSLGANLIMIMPGKFASGGAGFGSGMIGGINFDEKDVRDIGRIADLSLVAPAFVKFAPINGIEKNNTYEVIASTADMFELLNYEVDIGSQFSKADNEKKSKVAVLGSGAAKNIFGDKNLAIGKSIEILDLGFKVIGILQSKGGGSLGGAGLDDHIFIPYKSASSLNPSKKFLIVYAKAKDETRIVDIKKEIEKTLLKRYDKDDFSVSDQQELMTTVTGIFNMINIVLVGIAAISLVVGGIGVMNIMYVSVAERVQEVGIRRAVGAMDHDILFLFLTEAVILCLLGGTIGIGLSYVIVLLIQPVFPAYIDVYSVMLALGVSFAIGLIFGVVPAKRASKLTPIEAIRSE